MPDQLTDIAERLLAAPEFGEHFRTEVTEALALMKQMCDDLRTK